MKLESEKEMYKSKFKQEKIKYQVSNHTSKKYKDFFMHYVFDFLKYFSAMCIVKSNNNNPIEDNKFLNRLYNHPSANVVFYSALFWLPQTALLGEG